MAAEQEIYKGFWTNWIDGQVAGATLTLSREGGAYLIAFLALFVHVAGASFWRLASFAIFWYRAHPDLDDTAILQQQTVFRNSASAISSLRGFLKISIRSKEWKKNLPVIAWAFMNVVGFLSAGFLSSRVTSTRSDVLLRPTNCGEWTFADIKRGNRSNFVVEEAIWASTLAKITSTSQQYAAVCYNPENAPEGCSTFGRLPPQWTSNMVQDGYSGFIASDVDLGINSHPADRVSLRTRLACASLKQNGYVKTYTGAEVASLFLNNKFYGSAKNNAQSNFNEPLEHQKFDAFFYGPSVDFNSPNVNDSTATYIFNRGTLARSVGVGAVTNVFLAAPSFELWRDGSLDTKSNFNPIPALKVPEHEVSLLFLSTNAWSSALITDPWFKTDQPIDIEFTIGHDKPRLYTLYERNPATTVLGCAQKFEMCVGTSNDSMHCIVTTGEGKPYEGGDPQALLGLTHRQEFIAHRLRQANLIGNLAGLVYGSGATGLLAYDSLAGIFEAPLPHDQWTLEVQNWFAEILTIQQAYTTPYVTGLSDERFDKYLVPPAPDEQWMCHNQVVQRRDYASFSVLGICIILILGGFITGLNMLVVRISGILLPRSARNEFRESSWDANELLELRAEAFGERMSQVDGRSITTEKVDALRDEHSRRASSGSE